MMETVQFAAGLDALFDIDSVPDYSDNGLQVEAGETVRKAAFAVDASLATFERAAALKADILVVHHGLYWGRVELLRGYPGERIKFLFRNNLSLYAVHLPLDAHPELGNSAALVELSGAVPESWFARERGLDLGCLGTFPKGTTWGDLNKHLAGEFGHDPLCIVGEPEDDYPINRIGAVTGGGMKFALDAASAGADVYISGEPSHAWYHPVLETGIPCILYGHYATETLGIRRLMSHVEKEMGLETVFIDFPTGM